MMPRIHRRLAAGGLCLLLALSPLSPLSPRPARAAEPAAAELTLEQAMADQDWIGNLPENPYWSDDGRSIYYEREREGIGRQRKDLYRVDLASGKVTLIEPAQRARADAPGERNLERTRKVYLVDGDVFVKDLKTGAVRQITRTGEAERDVHFLADGRRIWFHRGTDVFIHDLDSGVTWQAADLKLAKDPAEKDTKYLSEQQTRLFDVIRQKQEKEKREREEDKALAKTDPTRTPLPWYLGKEIQIEMTSLSPSGDWLAVVTAPKREEPGAGTKMPDWVTESGNIEIRDVRSKVGPAGLIPHSVILLDLKAHERHDLDWPVLPGIKDDPLKGLREAAEARNKAARKDDEKKDEKKDAEKKDEKKDEKKPESRPLEVQKLVWTDDGDRLALMLRARDNKDRWIATWDAAGGALTPRHRLTDAAWINWDFNDLGWLRDNETLWYLSEESGWSQLYRLSTRTGETKRLTPGGAPEGKYEVSRT
ncbi:MAG TPA: DPP IV N-terminal domain-containing protein, partial [Thermoanaerobaculia bacterium]